MKMKIWVMLLFVPLVLTACGQEPVPQTEPSVAQSTEETELVTAETELITEDPGISLSSDYISLSYPTELEDMVQVQYENSADGQQIIFTTAFTGEDLELFRFVISKSGDQGYRLGTLTDPEYGELAVCVDVKDYSNGSWTPEEYTKLGAMQERVNDLIAQFHEDPRFTPTKP